MSDGSVKQDKTVSYVVAVSGGVDSVVLLDILRQRLPAGRLTVAHFDHGIRQDSAADRHFVGELAKHHGLSFVYDEGRLGPQASEADARVARYAFLRQVASRAGARYIVTAHHEDDVLETAIINLLRGTGRKGLSALRSHDDLYRPLLATPKAHIRAYAARHQLAWREDSTNSDPSYLRNYVRHNIMPKFDNASRDRLRGLIQATGRANIEIDSLLADQLHLQPAGDMLDREWFRELPADVANEIIAAWLRRLGITGFDRRTIGRLTDGIINLQPGKQVDINGRYIVAIKRGYAVVMPRR